MDNIKKKIPKRKLEEIREAFRLFDRDGDGSITKEELGQVMRNLGQFASEEELQQMLVEVDIDGDGNFSFDEFVEIMTNMDQTSMTSSEDGKRELQEAFKVIKMQYLYILRSKPEEVSMTLIDRVIEKMNPSEKAIIPSTGSGGLDHGRRNRGVRVLDSLFIKLRPLKVFDKHGRGFISASDLRAVLQCLGQNLTEEEIEDMIREVDLDGDGRINFDEFVQALVEPEDMAEEKQE